MTGGSLRPEGPAAAAIADLWWLMLVLGTLVTVVFVAVLVRAVRRGGSGDQDGEEGPRGGEEGAGRAWLLWGGAIGPAVVLVVVLGATLMTMRATASDPADDAVVVELVGHQWWWEVRYPEHGVVTANEVHLPVGRAVDVRLRSADVIHSFWVPALGGKVDLLPEHATRMTLRADEPGVHRSQCAEFCGLQHARMGMRVVAEPPDEFASWLVARAAPAEPPASAAARRGRDLFATSCARCHAIDGTEAVGSTAPDLTHLASRLTLGAGMLENTRENLRAWIDDPATFKPGVEMPAADELEPDGLGPEELDDVVTYLQGLR